MPRGSLERWRKGKRPSLGPQVESGVRGMIFAIQGRLIERETRRLKEDTPKKIEATKRKTSSAIERCRRKIDKINKTKEKETQRIQLQGNRAALVAAEREERIERIRQSTGEANKEISNAFTNVTGVLRKGTFVMVLGAGVVLSDVLVSTLCVAEAAVTFTYVTLAQVSLFAISLAGEAAGHFNKGQIGEWGISLSEKMGDTRQNLGYHFKRRMGDIGDRWKRNVLNIHQWAGGQISDYCRRK